MCVPALGCSIRLCGSRLQPAFWAPMTGFRMKWPRPRFPGSSAVGACAAGCARAVGVRRPGGAAGAAAAPSGVPRSLPLRGPKRAATGPERKRRRQRWSRVPSPLRHPGRSTPAPGAVPRRAGHGPNAGLRTKPTCCPCLPLMTLFDPVGYRARREVLPRAFPDRLLWAAAPFSMPTGVGRCRGAPSGRGGRQRLCRALVAPSAVHPRRRGSEAAAGRPQPAANNHAAGVIASARSLVMAARPTSAPAPAAASRRG